MGIQSSCIPSRTPVLDQNGMRIKPMREKDSYGVCQVKILSITSTAARRNQERVSTHVISPKGAIIHGSQCNPQLIQRALATSGFPFLTPSEIQLNDSRAHKLLVLYNDGWHAIPSPEPFSRHTGTCVVLGDRTSTSPAYKIKLGDCFRLGSVGLVVAEMRALHGEKQRLDPKILQYLKDETLTVDNSDDIAALAADENDANERESLIKTTPDVKADASFRTDVAWNEEHGGVGGGERFICYMCYETHDTPEDPLVAPCDCKGDTRYLHVQCLQRWYQSSVLGPQSQVIRTTGNGAPACKICGSAYKTAFRKADGRRANLLEIESSRPYVSLVVVTRHDTNPGLFNTKFRLNFGRMDSTDIGDFADNENSLLIGRSSSCNMVLDYRTVSTIHAQIVYENGSFMMSDKRSSNGTMVYLQEPLPLIYNQPVRLRMGRTTLTVQAKRSMTAIARKFFSRSSSSANQRAGFMSPADLQTLLVGTGSLLPQLQPTIIGTGTLHPSPGSREDVDRGTAGYSMIEGRLSGVDSMELRRTLFPGREDLPILDSNALSNRVREIESGGLASEEEMIMLAVLLSSEMEAKERERLIRERHAIEPVEAALLSPKPSSSIIPMETSLNILAEDDKQPNDFDQNSRLDSVPVHVSPPFRVNGIISSAMSNVIEKSTNLNTVSNSGFTSIAQNFNGFEVESPAFLDTNGNYTYAAPASGNAALLLDSNSLEPTLGSEVQSVLTPATSGPTDAVSRCDELNVLLSIPAAGQLLNARTSKSPSMSAIVGETTSNRGSPVPDKFTMPRQLSGSLSRPNSGGSGPGLGLGQGLGNPETGIAFASPANTSVAANLLTYDSVDSMADDEHADPAAGKDLSVRIRVRKVSGHNARISQPTTAPPTSISDVVAAATDPSPGSVCDEEKGSGNNDETA